MMFTWHSIITLYYYTHTRVSMNCILSHMWPGFFLPCPDQWAPYPGHRPVQGRGYHKGTDVEPMTERVCE